MGIIRLLLALSVVSLHCGPILSMQLVGGTAAVQAFYIISGFYMAMILTNKYVGKNHYKNFITNRLLKLLPTYWIILLTVIGLGIIGLYIGRNFIFERYNQSFDILPLKIQLLIIFSNLFIIGQDFLFFIGLDKSSGLFFENNYETSNFPLHHFIFVGQAWTLSIELMFYSIAPLINKLKSIHLTIIALLFLMCRFYLYSQGFNHKPWDYQFFPFELTFFLSGMLMFRFYNNLMSDKLLKQTKNGLPFFFFIVLFILTFQYVPLSNQIKMYLFYVCFVISLPFIFHYSKGSKIDRLIGELSYPVYLSHIMIGYVVGQLFPVKSFLFSLTTASLSIIFSILLNKYLIGRIEIYRQKRIEKTLAIRNAKNESIAN